MAKLFLYRYNQKMIKLYSLCGVDGCGKTSQINLLNEKIKNLSALRVPQTYLSTGVEYSDISKNLELIGKFADKFKLPLLKANASFFAFCLVGKIVNNIAKRRVEELIVLERYPLFDALVYAKFYQHFINTTLDELAISKNLLAEENIDIKKLNGQLNQLGILSEFNLFTVQKLIGDLLKLNEDDFFKKLYQIIGLEIPQKIVFLYLEKDEISKRLNDKRASGEVMEAHETVEFLFQMQSGLLNILDKLKNKLIQDYLVIKDKNMSDTFIDIKKYFNLE